MLGREGEEESEPLVSRRSIASRSPVRLLGRLSVRLPSSLAAPMTSASAVPPPAAGPDRSVGRAPPRCSPRGAELRRFIEPPPVSAPTTPRTQTRTQSDTLTRTHAGRQTYSSAPMRIVARGDETQTAVTNVTHGDVARRRRTQRDANGTRRIDCHGRRYTLCTEREMDSDRQTDRYRRMHT